MTALQHSAAFVAAPRVGAPAARRPLRTEASLRFRQRGGRTFLAGQFTPHPFHITRPFYRPDDPPGMATLYLQSSSGGLYGDDVLDLTIAAETDARAHVTSQASTMVPASLGGRARLAVHLRADAGATLEYVPDPLIVFDGADAETSLDVSLAPGARAIVADAILLHDPTGKRPASGRWQNTITVSVDGEPMPRLIERQCLGLGDPLAFGLRRDTGPGAMGPCYGALYCLGIDTAVAAGALSAGLAALAGAGSPAGEARWIYWGVNPLTAKGIVGARFLCGDGVMLSAALEAAWAAARRASGAAQPSQRRK
ncbi:MAG: urease accessory protein UreD [Bauldia sp.]|nr:urease accessory protein UreD [Bauldia sp.]